MTTATSDEPTSGSSTAPAARESGLLTPRRWRVDLIGASALVLAAAGFVGTIVLLRPTPAAPTTAISAPVVRDQWYLDPPNASIAQHAALPDSAVKDRWYEDAASATTITPEEYLRLVNGAGNVASTSAPATGVPAVRDQWYLDHPAQASGPKSSTPVRDQWYLDMRGTPAMAPTRPQDPAKDRWYRE